MEHYKYINLTLITATTTFLLSCHGEQNSFDFSSLVWYCPLPSAVRHCISSPQPRRRQWFCRRHDGERAVGSCYRGELQPVPRQLGLRRVVPGLRLRHLPLHRPRVRLPALRPPRQGLPQVPVEPRLLQPPKVRHCTHRRRRLLLLATKYVLCCFFPCMNFDTSINAGRIN